MAAKQLIRLPEKLVPAYYKALEKNVKSARKTGTKERNDTVNPHMRPDQALQSAFYKAAVEIEAAKAVISETSSLVKSMKRGQVGATKGAASPGNGVVAGLAAQLAELSKKVGMLVSNQPKSVFDGAFTHGPREITVEKSVESSIFDGAFQPRDLTEIKKAAERTGYWPLSIKHEGPGSVVVKSSTLCLGEHEEVHAPLSKSAGADMEIFASAFARL